MTNLKPVDVAIIGGGWTGLAMAKELVSRSSVNVMALERGAPQTLADYAMDMDELDYNIRLRMMQNIAEETVTHRHSARDSAVPVRQYGSFHPGTGVGGAGEHWTGMCFRFARPRRPDYDRDSHPQPYVTGPGLKGDSAFANRQCSAHVFLRPLATSRIKRNSSQPTSSIVA